MNRQRRLSRTVVIAVLAIVSRSSGLSPAAAPACRRDVDDAAIAAREVYQQATEKREQARNAETAYQWSMRWSNALIDSTACPADQLVAANAHLARMELLLTEVTRQHEAHNDPPESLAAAKYYAVEARITARPVSTAATQRDGRDPAALAQQAFNWSKDGFDVGIESQEALYQWSHRWMKTAARAASDRSQQIAAAKAHLERMKRLYVTVKMLHDFSTDSASRSVAAAKYYLLAATLSMTPPDASTRNRDARDLLSAAKEAYDWWHACWEIGIRGNPEELHRWSLRWTCAADRVSRDQHERLAAATEHLLRMERLLADVQAKSPRPFPVAAARFYVAEAKNLHRRLLQGFSP